MTTARDVYTNLVLDIMLSGEDDNGLPYAVLNVGNLSNLGAGLIMGALFYKYHPDYTDALIKSAVDNFPNGGEKGAKKNVDELVQRHPIGGEDAKPKHEEGQAKGEASAYTNDNEDHHTHHWRNETRHHTHEGGREAHDHSQ